MGYWTDGAEERLLIGTADAWLLSLDARTGRPDPQFGVDGRVDLTVGIRDVVRSTNFSARRPLVAGDVVVVGNSIGDSSRTRRMPPGDVQAYDVRTGRKLWTFHTIPREYESGYETWLNGSAEYTGNANVWAGIAYDPQLDYLYMATSTPTNNFYGGERLGDNLLRRERGLRGGEDRRARLAFPSGAPRHLGLRLRRHAGAWATSPSTDARSRRSCR